jgi:hypothetical protein
MSDSFFKVSVEEVNGSFDLTLYLNGVISVKARSLASPQAYAMKVALERSYAFGVKMGQHRVEGS